MKHENTSAAVDFKAFPDGLGGTNTRYSVEVYVRPESWGRRTIFKILSIIPSFDRMIDSRINELNGISRALFTRLRENPYDIYKTTLTLEEKERIFKMFK